MKTKKNKKIKMNAKEQAFMSADSYYYEGASSSSEANSGYSGSVYSYCSNESGLSILSTSTTYGSYGSWTGGDTHASGYEADAESLASNQ